MKRIYEALAYEAPTDCWWWQDVPAPQAERLERDRRVEVAVIGSGYTGLVAALELAEAGVEVAVLDAERLGFGASTRNGGFCCLGGAKASTAQITRAVGADGLRAWRQTEIAAVRGVEARLDRYGMDVDRHSQGETLLAHTPKAWAEMQAEADEVRTTYGFDAEYLKAEALRDHGLGGSFHGAMTLPVGFALNPAKYHAGLVQAAQAAGVMLFDRSPVTAIRQDGAGWRLVSERASVVADKVILATNGYSSEDVPDWLRARYLPVLSSVFVTRPLRAEEQADQGWHSAQMAYDSRWLLHYFRLMPDGRFLFGMRGGLKATASDEIALRRRARRNFETMFPGFAGAEATHHWSGLVCLTARLAPYVGPVAEMPGVFAGFGYHGNGVAMASHSGHLLAQILRGGDPGDTWPALMRQRPKRFPLGGARRALLAPAYALAGWRDR